MQKTYAKNKRQISVMSRIPKAIRETGKMAEIILQKTLERNVRQALEPVQVSLKIYNGGKCRIVFTYQNIIRNPQNKGLVIDSIVTQALQEATVKCGKIAAELRYRNFHEKHLTH